MPTTTNERTKTTGSCQADGEGGLVYDGIQAQAAARAGSKEKLIAVKQGGRPDSN